MVPRTFTAASPAGLAEPAGTEPQDMRPTVIAAGSGTRNIGLMLRAEKGAGADPVPAPVSRLSRCYVVKKVMTSLSRSAFC